jgi:hypothetical protein
LGYSLAENIVADLIPMDEKRGSREEQERYGCADRITLLEPARGRAFSLSFQTFQERFFKARLYGGWRKLFPEQFLDLGFPAKKLLASGTLLEMHLNLLLFLGRKHSVNMSCNDLFII